MKRKLLAFGITAFSILLSTSSQTQGADSQSLGSSNNKITPTGTVHNHVNNFIPQRTEYKQEMLQKFDANGDGKIDSAEREQMRQARRSKRTLDGQ